MSKKRNPGSLQPPVLDVQISVNVFRDVINGPLSGGSLTSHTIALHGHPPQFRLHYLPSQAGCIFVPYPGTILRFAAPSGYAIVGLAFQTAFVPTPTAVLWGIGSHPIAGSPFTVVGHTPSLLEVKDDVPSWPEGTQPVHKFYKFTLKIQRLNDGLLGLIDPYIENEN